MLLKAVDLMAMENGQIYTFIKVWTLQGNMYKHGKGQETDRGAVGRIENSGWRFLTHDFQQKFVAS